MIQFSYRAARKLTRLLQNRIDKVAKNERLLSYEKSGRKAWNDGYLDVREEFVKKCLDNSTLLESIEIKLPTGYGVGLDERVVEYPWTLSHIKKSNQKVLDAGSTFNYRYLLENSFLKNQNLTIQTLFPEGFNLCENKINYVFGDLRNLDFKDRLFDVVMSISTIEHIGMDNSIYGESSSSISKVDTSRDYLLAISEYLRVLKDNGTLLLSFPYGVYEKHSFFQQFDEVMLMSIVDFLKKFGQIKTVFYQYSSAGWLVSDQENCNLSTSFNPHTGVGKGEDGAAHSRAVCCLEFIKMKSSNV